MPRSNGGHVARSPSQGSVLNYHELALVDAKSYRVEAAVLTGASSASDAEGAVASSRPRTFRKGLVTFAGLLLMILFVSFLSRDEPMLPGTASPLLNTEDELTVFMHPTPELVDGYHHGHKQLDPLRWLRDNSHIDPVKLPSRRTLALQASRPKAALISLVNNSDVAAMVHTVTQLEASFNAKKLHRYDWVFFNHEEFTDEFKAAVLNISSSRCFFERIPKEHWSVPHWVDHAEFAEARHFLEDIDNEVAWQEYHHHKSRWNAGLFALESRLQGYEWYWRVEPGVQYTCHIKYDIFQFMRDNNMAYGFNLALLGDARFFPSLWDRTKVFKLSHPNMVHPEADMGWALHTPRDSRDVIRSASTPAGYEIMTEEEEYNSCQFYSNFEVGSLDYFRGEKHQSYFQHLDRSGGFYYERFGDAPVHTLSVNMFLPKRRVWYFRDIGYPHAFCRDCPPHVEKLTYGPEQDPKKIRAAELNASLRRRRKELDQYRKHFEREREAPSLYCGHTIGGLDHDNSRLVPYTSKQKKPFHTCIRLWLGGKWLVKRRGWSREEEMSLGGDGYGGYLVDSLPTYSLEGDEPVLRILQDWRSRTDNNESSSTARLYSWLYFVLMIVIVATMA
ncbi:uncharacterized protein PG986_004771 [Apiospora aurea]|uniref:Uncharacterized protein n=1 Tax=Apiospora aurea TaxID=335848 RepID=A0ABR1QNJ5_9PEZI